MAVNRLRSLEGRMARLRGYQPCLGHGARAVARSGRQACEASLAGVGRGRLGGGSRLDRVASVRIQLSAHPSWRGGSGRLQPGRLQPGSARAWLSSCSVRSIARGSRRSVGRAAAMLTAAGEAS